MKVILVWSVAAWVVSVTADRPCAEYCVYLSSDTRDIEFQTGCDCTYQEFPDNLDDVSIYYEPVIHLPEYIQNRPFNILNPVTQERQTHSNNNKPIVPENIPSYLKSRTHEALIERNVENDSTLNRKEKATQSNNQRSSAPFYLDINMESDDDERSASSNLFAAEELKLTEQRLLDCAEISAVLHSRKSTNEINTVGQNQNSKYSQLSNTELRKLIQEKCSYITYIVEKSLNEIKKARPKLTSIVFRVDDDNQQNNDDVHTNKIRKPNNNNICITTTEKTLHSRDQNEDDDSNINPEQTIIIYTDSDESISDNLSTFSSEVSSIALTPTSVENIQSSADIYAKTDVSSVVTGKLIEQSPKTTPIYKENEYILHNKDITSPPSTMTKTFTSPTPIFVNTNAVEQEVSENQHFDKEFRTTNSEGLFVGRLQYEEGEVPLTRIITQEFSNDTVQSYINGTEDIPNGDFEDEIKRTEVDNKSDDSSRSSPHYEHNGTTSRELETSTPNIKTSGITASEISGNIYLIFNDRLIPARFIQNVNGSLSLGIDGATLCNTLTQNGECNSTLLTILCNCYTSGNCTQKDNN